MSTGDGREGARVVVPRRTPDGGANGELELDSSMFGAEPNVPLMHQVVNSQLAAARSGTHSTRTRAEARGGGAKPYRQKGTGRARQGSERAPHFVGGGVALGPKPRSYRQRTPKKMVRGALESALSDRARSERVVVVDQWAFDEPSTKAAAEVLDALGLEGRVLVVLGPEDWAAGRSFANLARVDVTSTGELSAYDVLRTDWVVFSQATLPGSFVATEATQEAAAGDAGAEAEAEAEPETDEEAQ